MIDTLTPKGRIVAAVLKLASERRWDDISMMDIADASGLPLVDLRKEFERKSQMLSSFGYMVDAEVLRKAPRPSKALSPRDAVFEVVMARFDALQPYKAAMKSVSDGGALDGSLLKSLMRSQTAMLQAAGIDTEGPTGAIRVTGLAGVFTRTFRTWLDDTDPGMARTMAFLDRQLRSAERTMGMMTGACNSLRQFGQMFQRNKSSASPPQSAPASPSTNAPPNPMP
jgi:ubiquinone biosynthesis protein COQ9